MDASTIESLTLRRVATGETGLHDLWEQIARNGAPLVEALPDDPDHVLVTFLLRGTCATRNAVVVGGPAGFDTPQNGMQRLGATDLWFRSYRVARGVRCLYDLSENDSLTPLWATSDHAAVVALWKPDTLNPRRCTIIEGEGQVYTRSLLELPDAPLLRESRPVPETTRGELRRHHFESKHLGNTRPVDVYTPHPSHGSPRALLIVFDGIAFTRTVPTHTILDNLHADGRIPPTAALFVDSMGALRNRELPCHAPFAAFVG
ncbi:MAG: enterochelin esterase domain-containing protein, partial [Polyangiales bacterium]